jgi:transposase-like protein
MPVSGEEKRRIIDLHFNQGKTIREVCRIMGKSSHDITPVTKEHRIRLAQNYALANGEKSEVVQGEEDRVIPNVKAYKLFDEGKSLLEVTADLNLPWPQVKQFYAEFLNMKRMYKLVTIYHDNQDSMGYFLKLFRLGKEKGVTPEQIMNLIQMADSIHRLQDKLQRLQTEISDISTRKSEGQEELDGLHNKIINTKEKLDTVKKTFDIKYEELKEACSQAQKLQNYVEQFKDGQDYHEVESIVRSEVKRTLLDNRKLLHNALFSVLLALRNDPDRYLMIDRIELTPFTTTIINYDSFLALGHQFDPQRNEQLSGKVLEVARKILSNLQKSIVDSTISIAAGLEERNSYPVAYQILPYYESPSGLADQGELE